jgi:hypothetical protein
VNPHSSPIYKSYVKTTAMSFMLVVVMVTIAALALHGLPGPAGYLVALGALLAVLPAATGACAGLIVLARYRRGAAGREDLYLELNRSRTAAVNLSSATHGVSSARRRLVRRMFGHDLVVGDLVEIKSWAEISATLDERGCLEELPFMPEMVAMCGQRARVFRSLHRIFDYRKTRRMRQLEGAVLLAGVVCGGERHGGCEAACLTAWKSSWLRRVDQSTTPRDFFAIEQPPHSSPQPVFGTHAPHYSCQLTQLSAASKPIDGWSLIDTLRPLVSGNVAPAAFVVGWLTNLFNDIQQWRRGAGYPNFEATVNVGVPAEEQALKVGDSVVVRSSAEIRVTLNAQSLNRGLYFEPDMLKYCGQRIPVKAEVRRIIDIVTGEIRHMKTPAYLLDDVRFSGERQLFNAQHEPLFWRAIWLRRDEG